MEKILVVIWWKGDPNSIETDEVEKMTISLIPYIITNGNGQEAVKFYQDVFGAEISALHTYGEIPDSPTFTVPKDAKDLIMHAHLKFDDVELMLTDEFPGREYKVGSHLSIAIVLDETERAQEIFNKLKQGGKVELDLQKTDWSPLYGQVIDKYGVSWQISLED